MLKLILICNSLPRVPSDDPAAWNRFRVLKHLSNFPKLKSLVPEKIEDQYRLRIFPRDNEFSTKLPGLKTAMMWKMFSEYKRICREGRMEEPEQVHMATVIYRENNDVILQYIKDFIVEDNKFSTTHTELYNSFKDWFRQSCPNIPIPDKNDVKEDLENRGWKMDGRKWVGVKISSKDEDDQDEDEDYEDENIKDEEIKISKFKKDKK
jgi:phage/plasmid-associated DNA primase